MVSSFKLLSLGAHQKGLLASKHFTVVARHRNVLWRVMIVFAGICKGKLKIITCFVRQKKFIVFFVAHEARYDWKEQKVLLLSKK